MTPLITAAQLLQAIPELTADQQTELPATLTAIAEGFVGRPLSLRSLIEEHLPDEDGEFRLTAYPVVEVRDLRTQPSSVLTLSYVAAPGTWAAGVRFRFDDPANPDRATAIALTASVAGSETTSLVPWVGTSGTLPATAQALAAAISTVAPWSATVTAGQEACPVGQIRPFRFGQSALEAPVHLLAFTRPIHLSKFRPATGHASIGPAGASYYFGRQPLLDPQTVRVDYSGGFNADPAVGPVTVPGDLAECLRQMARQVLDQRRVSGVIGQVGVGNSSVTAADRTAALTPAVRGYLNRFIQVL